MYRLEVVPQSWPIDLATQKLPTSERKCIFNDDANNFQQCRKSLEMKQGWHQIRKIGERQGMLFSFRENQGKNKDF